MNDKGELGEKLALEYLENKGYRFVDRNFHSAFGEIDLIVEDDDYLVFVEVKTREDDSFGPPEATVHIHKQNRLYFTTQFYLSLNPSRKYKRFDVITVLLNSGEIKHIEDAFRCGI